MLRKAVAALIAFIAASMLHASAEPCPTCVEQNKTVVEDAMDSVQADPIELFWGAVIKPTATPSSNEKGVIRGLVVEEVHPGGPLASAGVMPGMIILEANGQSVATTDDLKFAISTARSKILLAIRSGSKTIYKVIRNTGHDGW